MGHSMNTLSIFIAAKKWAELLFAVDEVHFFVSWLTIYPSFGSKPKTNIHTGKIYVSKSKVCLWHNS